MTSLEEAHELILEAAAPLAAELLPLEEACGRVSAEEIRAGRDEPPLPRAAMDGFAVRSADTAALPILRVVGTVGPGGSCPRSLGPGEAVRIATGAPLPEDADAVVPEEFTLTETDGIRLASRVGPGDYVVPVGAECRRGQPLLFPGTVLGPTELSVLAALGYDRMKVQRRPRVAVLSTGNELVEVSGRQGLYGVFASNLRAVVHLVNSCGGSALPVGIAPDRLEAVVSGIRQGLDADLVVTTGGTGRGEGDLLAAAVRELGGNIHFQGVAIAPGKQTLFARVREVPLLGLPGRSSAVEVAFHQMVRPALLRMLNLPHVLLPEITASLGQPVNGKAHVQVFVRCRVMLGGDGPRAVPAHSGTQGMMAEMLASNALVKLPPGTGRLGAGEQVRVQLLDLGLKGLSYFADGPNRPAP